MTTKIGYGDYVVIQSSAIDRVIIVTRVTSCMTVKD